MSKNGAKMVVGAVVREPVSALLFWNRGISPAFLALQRLFAKNPPESPAEIRRLRPHLLKACLLGTGAYQDHIRALQGANWAREAAWTS